MATKGLKKTTVRLLALAALFWIQTTLAIGTASGTSVTNNVSVDYELSGIAQGPQTDSVQFLVDNKVDLSIGVTDDTVSPAQSNQVITFVIVNEGNTAQGYALTASNSTIGDDFNMNNVRLYIETGAVAGFDATDTLYTSGSGNNAGDLNPIATAVYDPLTDDELTVYLVADVPPTGGGSAPLDAQNARYDLLVTTLNAGSNAVTTDNSGVAWNPNAVQNVFADGDGPHSNDATYDGKFSATGVYSVNAPAVSFVKTAVVDDGSGGSNPVDGATITYTLVVSVTGSGSIDNVVITDPVPANTTYVSNSLTLNAGALSDAADADAGEFSANQIAVDLGTLTNASGNQTITFSVTIN